MCACVCVQEVLVEQRTSLSDLLQQLLKQRDQREQELRQVLVRNRLTSVDSFSSPLHWSSHDFCHGFTKTFYTRDFFLVNWKKPAITLCFPGGDGAEI